MSKVEKKKIRVGVVFGGRSAEHEISLRSARNIIASIDRTKYEVVPLGITKKGRWLGGTPAKELLSSADARASSLISQKSSGNIIPFAGSSAGAIDVVFPVLHGTYGEDGTFQGLMKLAGVPFVGAGVLGSAVGMDKDVMKRLFQQAGIPTAEFILLKSPRDASFHKISKKIGLPFFIKPANAGSSVGVHKVKTKKDFAKALADAFRYDTKVLAERFIRGREIECSVLGNETPVASLPGEIRPTHEFYSYEAKYLDPNGAHLEVPARIPARIAARIRALAIKAFTTLCLEGMARVDFFLTPSGKIFINEVNTLPGFTNISMYPKLWEASGVSQTRLIDILIQLALERHEKEKKLRTDRSR